MAVDEKTLLEIEIQKQFPDATNFSMSRVGEKFKEGNIYMVTFDTSKIENKAYSWFYAYVNSTSVTLLDDGEEAIVFMENLLDKEKNFLQRINNFDFIDFIGAIIALALIGAFIGLVIVNGSNTAAISKEYLAIVSLILGYYFGRNKK